MSFSINPPYIIVNRHGGRILLIDLSKNPSRLAGFVVFPSGDFLTYIIWGMVMQWKIQTFPQKGVEIVLLD